MTHDEKPTVTIAHEIPGRIRLRFSARPADESKLLAAVKGHEGIRSAAYNARTGSLLVTFDRQSVTRDELVLRAALALSLDRGAAPVRVLTREEPEAISGLALFAGVASAGALLMRGGAATSGVTAKASGLAAATTALAVLHHGWGEVRERGNFDPEVLSLGYLLTSSFRGHFLAPSMLTWAMTFGRHLFEIPPPGVLVRPSAVEGHGEGEPEYEVIVEPDREMSERSRLLRSVQGLVRYLLTGGTARALIQDLREVSRQHGEVLEGMESMPDGIPLRFKFNRGLS